VKTAECKKRTIMLGNETNASTGLEELFGFPWGVILESTESGGTYSVSIDPRGAQVHVEKKLWFSHR
jgi:hypothetical protein